MLVHWVGSDEALADLLREIDAPAELPRSPDPFDSASRTVAIRPLVQVTWHENDPQEKVGTYHYVYVTMVRPGGDSLTVWAADFSGWPAFRSTIDVWLSHAGAHDWVPQRRALAAVLAPLGLADDSDGCVLALAMTLPAERDRILASLPGRRELAVDPRGVWIGTEVLNDDTHFPDHHKTAWVERDQRFVDGSWIPNRYQVPADAPLEVQIFFRR